MSKPSNLAYDYSIYEPVKKREPEQRIKVKKTVQQSSGIVFKAIFLAVASAALLCAIIYGNAEKTRLYNEMLSLDNQITLLASDNVRMQSEIEAKTNIKIVEEYAVNVLGLQKLDNSQIEYIELQKEDIILCLDEGDDNVFVSVKNWFNGVLEYIGA